MGSGSSVDKGSAAAAPPACPLFYNFSPALQHIPASTLPTRDQRGVVRRPQGGCAARVIALRHLPVVTAEAKKESKQFLSNVAKMRKAKQGDEAALARIADIEEQAKAIQNDPSISSTVSSCFLVNIAVDEHGRLAPLSTDGAAGLTDTTNVGEINLDTDIASECGSNAPASQTHAAGRKGFNFEAANNGQAPPGGGSGTPPPPHPNARKAQQTNGAPANSGPPGTNNLGALPSPTASRPAPTSTDSAVVQRLGQRPSGAATTAAAAAGATPPAPLMGSKVMPTIFAPPPATVSDNDADGEETDSNGQMNSSTRSLLIKDSRFRRGEGAENAAATAIAVPAATNPTNAVGDPTTTRLRRQNSRIKLMQVPNRTRWFLFNDSRTHEAQVTLLLSYMKATGPEKTGAQAKGDPKGNAATASNASPSDRSGGSLLEPGEMKVMCVPTPLSHAATPPKEVKKQLANSSSSSRSFVEVEPLDVDAFVSALPTPAAGPQKDLLSKFEANASRMAAAAFFVVLAPGVTIFLSEGEATGYMVRTLMVPFNPSSSMAVLGRMLTPDLVLSSKQKTANLVKDCYRHKLIYLSPIEDTRPSGSAAVTTGNGASSTVPAARPAPLPPLPEVPSRHTPAPAAEPRRDTNASITLSTPVNHKPNTSTSITGRRSDSIENAPLPPIQAAQYRPQLIAATEPLNAPGDVKGLAKQPPSPQQHRLSRRPPSDSPTGAELVKENEGRAGDQDNVPLRRKRIGSMLRNPSLADGAPRDDDDERDRSFHRDLPSTNSLAISF